MKFNNLHVFQIMSSFIAKAGSVDHIRPVRLQ